MILVRLGEIGLYANCPTLERAISYLIDHYIRLSKDWNPKWNDRGFDCDRGVVTIFWGAEGSAFCMPLDKDERKQVELALILDETNNCVDSPAPPEAVGVWFPARTPPTVSDCYLVFVRDRWTNYAEVRYAWYLKPPATPWTTHPRTPYCRESRCVDGVTWWMNQPPPEAFDPFGKAMRHGYSYANRLTS